MPSSGSMQMLYGTIDALLSVDSNVVVATVPAVDGDIRNVALLKLVDNLCHGSGGEGEHCYSRGTSQNQSGQGVLDDIWIFSSTRAEQKTHGVPVFAKDLLEGLHLNHMQFVLCCNQDVDFSALASSQRLRYAVWSVSELVYDLIDALPCFLSHASIVLEHAVDRPGRNTCRLGYISE